MHFTDIDLLNLIQVRFECGFIVPFEIINVYDLCSVCRYILSQFHAKQNSSSAMRVHSPWERCFENITQKDKCCTLQWRRNGRDGV